MNKHGGYLYLILGPMYSGKTSTMGTQMDRHHRAGRKCVIVKHSIDNRYNDLAVNGGVVSHCGIEYGGTSITVLKTSQLADINIAEYDVVGIDEGQFFPDIAQFTRQWASESKIIVCAYLDAMADGRPFGDIGALVANAETVVKLTSICHTCQNDASFSYHLGDTDDLSKAVGGVGKYVPLCRKCFNDADNRKKMTVTV